jgi:hypothetical protein
MSYGNKKLLYQTYCLLLKNMDLIKSDAVVRETRDQGVEDEHSRDELGLASAPPPNTQAFAYGVGRHSG